MSCSCTGNTRTCNCNKCRGIRLNQFSPVNVIASSNQFVLANNTLITYSTLLNSILASVPFHEPHIEEHFISIAARDDYFATQSNVDMLVTDFPISVNVVGTIKFYYWSGIDAPPTYDPNDWLLMSIDVPVGQNIVEVLGGTYVMDGTEDIIFCTGAVTIDLPSIISAFKSVIVNADGGTVTMNPDGSDTVQTTAIVSPNSGKFGPKLSTTEWRDI